MDCSTRYATPGRASQVTPGNQLRTGRARFRGQQKKAACSGNRVPPFRTESATQIHFKTYQSWSHFLGPRNPFTSHMSEEDFHAKIVVV